MAPYLQIMFLLVTGSRAEKRETTPSPAPFGPTPSPPPPASPSSVAVTPLPGPAVGAEVSSMTLLADLALGAVAHNGKSMSLILILVPVHGFTLLVALLEIDCIL